MRSRCPVCHKIVEIRGTENKEDTAFYPFCSERCKLVDLGAWLDAKYRITAGQQPDKSAEPSETASASPDNA